MNAAIAFGSPRPLRPVIERSYLQEGATECGVFSIDVLSLGIALRPDFEVVIRGSDGSITVIDLKPIEDFGPWLFSGAYTERFVFRNDLHAIFSTPCFNVTVPGFVTSSLDWDLPNITFMQPVGLTSVKTDQEPPSGSPALTRSQGSLAGYDEILDEIRSFDVWSWRRLATLLGSSHTELTRIAKGQKLPSRTLAPKIDELHRFVQRLMLLTRRSKPAIRRALTTHSTRFAKSAEDMLRTGDYSDAWLIAANSIRQRPDLRRVPNYALTRYDSAMVAIDSDDEELDNES